MRYFTLQASLCFHQIFEMLKIENISHFEPRDLSAGASHSETKANHMLTHVLISREAFRPHRAHKDSPKNSITFIVSSTRKLLSFGYHFPTITRSCISEATRCRQRASLQSVSRVGLFHPILDAFGLNHLGCSILTFNPSRGEQQ